VLLPILEAEAAEQALAVVSQDATKLDENGAKLLMELKGLLNGDSV